MAERSPKTEARNTVASGRAVGFRISGLGLLLDFGFQISDFDSNLSNDLHRTLDQPRVAKLCLASAPPVADKNALP
jgi:hypothetical protein